MWEYKLVNVKLSIAIQLLGPLLRKSPALFAPIAPMGLVALMGMGGAFWFVPTAIAPLSAQAYTARVDVSIDRLFGESYQTLLRRAEAIARAATQRSFDQDILVTDVSVMVLIQTEGAIAPILSLEATRQGWRSHPDPHTWITYYPTAESLLRLQDTAQFPNGQQRNSASPYSQPSSGYPVVPVPPATINPNTQPSATPRRPNGGTQPQTNPNTQPSATPRRPNGGTQPQVVPLPTQTNQ